MSNYVTNTSDKKKNTALLLCIFLGIGSTMLSFDFIICAIGMVSGDGRALLDKMNEYPTVSAEGNYYDIYRKRNLLDI